MCSPDGQKGFEMETSKIVDLEDCEYCGNTSDIVDSRGCCPACGAKRKKKEKKVFPSMRVEYAYGVDTFSSSDSGPSRWICST